MLMINILMTLVIIDQHADVADDQHVDYADHPDHADDADEGGVHQGGIGSG